MAVLVKHPAWTGWAGPSAGIALGVVLIAAPAVFGYTGTGHEVAQRVAGPLMVMFWIPSYWEATRSLIWWAAVVAGGLLVASLLIPSSLDGEAVGILGALATVIAALLTHPGDVGGRYAGGWLGLWRGESPEAAG